MDIFSAYAAIVSGLANLAAANRPEAFYYNGELFLITGINGSPIKGYKWNATNSAWEVNAQFETFDTNPGNSCIPCVFIYNNDLYLLTGANLVTTIKGFKWSVANLRWETNASIITGISTAKQSLSPTVFSIGTDMYLIIGSSDGIYQGYLWNGTQWVANSGITTGLIDIGNYARPETYYYNGVLFLHDANNYRWTWNTGLSQWDLAATGSSTLTGRFTVFEKDGYTYGINGSSSGGWSGSRLQSTAKITSVAIATGNNIKAKLVVNLSEPLEATDSLVAYNAPSQAELGNPAYIVPLTQKDSLTWEYQTNITEGTSCNFRANQIWRGEQLDTAQVTNTAFWILPVLPVTTINITDANNYRTLNSPSHNQNHGSLFYNGFVYGSARNTDLGNSDIFKVEAANYSNLIQKTIYQNKNQSLTRIYNFDQIIYCKGFLWVHSNQYLVRINLTDLDYMVFSGLPIANSEPLVADEEYIYLTGGISATKIDASLLIGTFASYNYDGSAPVAVPQSALLASCAFISHHPTVFPYCHSSAVDAQYLYTAMTTVPTSSGSGYDDALSINICYLQKIRKSDMVTVGKVIIPRSTDDMVQSSEYLFLAPEFGTTGLKTYQLGYYWGLYAINKQTLEIKYLKCLTPRQSSNGNYNNCYGVFELGSKVVVQQSATLSTLVIDITNIESWGDNLPVGSETEAIFKFQLNGVNFTSACNELKVDNVSMVHTNTWAAPTLIFKFPLNTLTTEVKVPIIQTTLLSSNANSATVSGFVIEEGQSAITDVGFRYGTDPLNLNINVDVSPDTYDFQTVLESLTPGIYYIQAWGVNTQGTFYGNTVAFTTYNVLGLEFGNTSALLAWIDENNGCSIRCVQDAPGVADGTTGTVTDQDGNTYNTIVINGKRWMVENLKTTKYRDGTLIPEVTDNTEWAALSTGAYCVN